MATGLTGAPVTRPWSSTHISSWGVTVSMSRWWLPMARYRASIWPGPDPRSISRTSPAGSTATARVVTGAAGLGGARRRRRPQRAEPGMRQGLPLHRPGLARRVGPSDSSRTVGNADGPVTCARGPGGSGWCTVTGGGSSRRGQRHRAAWVPRGVASGPVWDNHRQMSADLLRPSPGGQYSRDTVDSRLRCGSACPRSHSEDVTGLGRTPRTCARGCRRKPRASTDPPYELDAGRCTDPGGQHGAPRVTA